MDAIIIFGGNEYRFEGVHFEFHPYLGPVKLNCDGSPSKKGMGKKFWEMWERFSKLSKEEKEKYLVWKSPGCIHC